MRATSQRPILFLFVAVLLGSGCDGLVVNVRLPSTVGTTRIRVPLALSMAPKMTFTDGISPRQLVAQGMDAFRKGDVHGSIQLFDQADAMLPDGSLTPFLWQRGLSYYYADQFEVASKQARALCQTSLLMNFHTHSRPFRYLWSVPN
jgi:hypothetical protein